LRWRLQADSERIFFSYHQEGSEVTGWVIKTYSVII